MSESEEKGYEVVDKRKIKLDEEGNVQESAEEQPSPEEPDAEVGGMNLPPVDVYSLVKSFIGILGMHAWQWMGLVTNPVTGKLEKDLSQAKTAIDTMAALVQQIEPGLDEAERREIQGMLSDLRINFVQQSARQQ